jgi:polyphosphate glucokinase
MKVLAVDVGGSHVKIMATGHRKERKVASGPAMLARGMMDTVLDLAGHRLCFSEPLAAEAGIDP